MWNLPGITGVHFIWESFAPHPPAIASSHDIPQLFIVLIPKGRLLFRNCYHYCTLPNLFDFSNMFLFRIPTPNLKHVQYMAPLLTVIFHYIIRYDFFAAVLAFFYYVLFQCTLHLQKPDCVDFPVCLLWIPFRPAWGGIAVLSLWTKLTCSVYS